MDEDGAQEVASELEGRHVGGWGLLQIAGGTGLAAYSVWALVLMPGFRKVPLKLQVPYMPASAKQVENVMLLLKGRAGKMVDLGSGDGRIVRHSLPVYSYVDAAAIFSDSLLVTLQVLEAARRGFHPAVGYELNPWLLRLSYFYAWRSGYHRRVTYLREDLWKVKLRDCDNISIFLAPSVLELLEKKMLVELPGDARVVTGRFPLPTWVPSDIIGEGIDRAWAYDIKTVRQAVKTKELGTEV